MKKFLCMFLVVMLMLTLVACTKDDKDTKETEAPTQPQVTTTEPDLSGLIRGVAKKVGHFDVFIPQGMQAEAVDDDNVSITDAADEMHYYKLFATNDLEEVENGIANVRATYKEYGVEDVTLDADGNKWTGVKCVKDGVDMFILYAVVDNRFVQVSGSGVMADDMVTDHLLSTIHVIG